MYYVLGIKNIKIFLLFILATYYMLHTTAPLALAQEMSNSNYILRMSNLNSAAGNPSGSGYKLGVTVGQTAPGLYSGTNYKVRAGFQYIKSIIPFAFSISQTLIDFGTLTAANPITRTANLTISIGSANGYSVTAFENHQLLSPAGGSLIPDTTCDAGTCSQTTAAAWTSSLTYGFGYRCDNTTGTDCSTDFSGSTFYKQFADNSISEAPQTVMTGANVGRNKISQVTYKVNISSTQAAGFYNNAITYIATPKY